MEVPPKYRHRRKSRMRKGNFGVGHVELEELVRWTIRQAFCPNLKLIRAGN